MSVIYKPWEEDVDLPEGSTAEALLAENKRLRKGLKTIVSLANEVGDRGVILRAIADEASQTLYPKPYDEIERLKSRIDDLETALLNIAGGGHGQPSLMAIEVLRK